MNRLTTLSEFESKLQMLRTREGWLKDELRASAPESLAAWLKETDFIDNIFICGQCTFSVHYGEWGEYGFEDANAAKHAFTELEKAWNDAIEITLEDDKGGRINVSFKVPS